MFRWPSKVLIVTALDREPELPVDLGKVGQTMVLAKRVRPLVQKHTHTNAHVGW